MTSLPLAGVRIVDMTRLLPGNVCTQILARLGAEVIKVEDRARGDYQREFGQQVDGQGVSHHLFNRGKRSIALNLKSDDDRLVYEELVRQCHVLVESFRPGVLDRLGYTEERLRDLRPDLVITHITGYGGSSPLSSQAGHDINYIAFSGLLHRTGSPDGPPIVPPVPIADIVGGGLLPSLLTIAYVHRARATGQGAVIDASIADAIALLPNMVIADVLAGVMVPTRGRVELSGGLACYAVYAVTDGHVAVGALEERFWHTLCDVAGLPEHRDDHRAPERQDEIRRALTSFFADLSRSEVEERFAGSDACVSVVLSYEEMLASEHAQTRGFVTDLRPDELVPDLAFAGVVDGQRLTVTGPAPRQGEDSTAILRSLGLDVSP